MIFPAPVYSPNRQNIKTSRQEPQDIKCDVFLGLSSQAKPNQTNPGQGTKLRLNKSDAGRLFRCWLVGRESKNTSLGHRRKGKAKSKEEFVIQPPSIRAAGNNYGAEKVVRCKRNKIKVPRRKRHGGL